MSSKDQLLAREFKGVRVLACSLKRQSSVGGFNTVISRQMRRQEQTETTVTSTRIRILYSQRPKLHQQMIRIIEPEEAALNCSHHDPGEDAEESDVEFEVVDREQIGNQTVFQWTRILLLSLFATMLVVLIVSSPRKAKTIIEGLTYLRVETAYELRNGEPLYILIQSGRLESQQQLEALSQLCLREEIASCWREVLLVKGSMQPQLEQWILGRVEADVGVVWRESYLLAVILAALSGARVDVIGGQQEGLDTLRVNINALGLQDLVTLLEEGEFSSFFWQKYSLVLTAAEFFTQVIYADLLERSVRIGLTLDSTGIMVQQFTSKTSLLIEVQNISLQSRETLEKLTNQIFLITNEDSKERAASIISAGDRFVLIDSRLKPQQHSSSYQPAVQLPYLPTRSESWGARENFNLKPVWYVERLPPQELLSFFKCPSKENPFVELGHPQQAEIYVVDREEKVEEFQRQSHTSNFIYTYLQALGGSSILVAEGDPTLINLVVMASRARVFLPSELFQRLQEDTGMKNAHRVRSAELTKLNFQQYVVSNEVGLLIASSNFLTQFQLQIVSSLRLGMHMILTSQEQFMEQLLRDITQQFYVYLIGKEPLKLQSSCLFDFTSTLYQSNSSIPKGTLLLLSYFPLQVERSARRKERGVQNILVPCFSAQLSEMPSQNLRPGGKTVTISRETKMTVGNDEMEVLLERTRAEIALASFFRGNLYAEDKLLIVGSQSIGNYALIQAIRVIHRKGSLSLINFSDEQLQQIESLLLQNDITLNYEAFRLPTLYQLELNSPFILVIPEDLLKEKINLISRLHSGSMILSKIQGEKIHQYLDSLKGSTKRYIIEAPQQFDYPPASLKGLVCSFYRVDEVLPIPLFSGSKWLVILTN